MAYIERLSHMALKTVDLEKSVEFYTKVIGLTLHSRGKVGDAPLVVLVEGIGLTTGGPGAGHATVVDHFAFKVPDLGPVVERLKAVGAMIVDGPRPSPYGNSVYFLDPDGNKVECHDGERA